MTILTNFSSTMTFSLNSLEANSESLCLFLKACRKALSRKFFYLSLTSSSSNLRSHLAHTSSMNRAESSLLQTKTIRLKTAFMRKFHLILSIPKIVLAVFKKKSESLCSPLHATNSKNFSLLLSEKKSQLKTCWLRKSSTLVKASKVSSSFEPSKMKASEKSGKKYSTASTIPSPMSRLFSALLLNQSQGKTFRVTYSTTPRTNILLSTEVRLKACFCRNITLSGFLKSSKGIWSSKNRSKT